MKVPDPLVAASEFGDVERGTRGAAVFSADRAYRYALTRQWGEGAPLVWMLLNPSTADADQDDPTIRRCVGFSKQWGYEGLVILNLFAFRATDPRAMRAAADPVGRANDAAIRAFAIEPGADVLCAWGAHGEYRGRGDAVREMLRRDFIGRYALAFPGLPLLTASGQPRHPLYAPYSAEMVTL